MFYWTLVNINEGSASTVSWPARQWLYEEVRRAIFFTGWDPFSRVHASWNYNEKCTEKPFTYSWSQIYDRSSHWFFRFFLLLLELNFIWKYYSKINVDVCGLLCNLWFNLCDFAPIMYNDKEICVRAMAHDDAYSRMKDVVRWYLSGFYKKPKVSLPSVNAFISRYGYFCYESTCYTNHKYILNLCHAMNENAMQWKNCCGKYVLKCCFVAAGPEEAVQSHHRRNVQMLLAPPENWHAVVLHRWTGKSPSYMHHPPASAWLNCVRVSVPITCIHLIPVLLVPNQHLKNMGTIEFGRVRLFVCLLWSSE